MAAGESGIRGLSWCRGTPASRSWPVLPDRGEVLNLALRAN